MRSALVLALFMSGLDAQAKPGLTIADLERFAYDFGESASVQGGKVPLADGRGGIQPMAAARLLCCRCVPSAISTETVEPMPPVSSSRRAVRAASRISSSRDGDPVQAGPPEWLGDRSIIESLSIDRKRILSVRYVTHRDSDRECCPTLRITDRYRVENGTLVGITK